MYNVVGRGHCPTLCSTRIYARDASRPGRDVSASVLIRSLSMSAPHPDRTFAHLPIARARRTEIGELSWYKTRNPPTPGWGEGLERCIRARQAGAEGAHGSIGALDCLGGGGLRSPAEAPGAANAPGGRLAPAQARQGPAADWLMG